MVEILSKACMIGYKNLNLRDSTEAIEPVSIRLWLRS